MTSHSEFRDFHLPALEQNEARHSVILAVIGSFGEGSNVLTWTLGAPGQCATMTPGWPILLADLDEAQCRQLADATANLEFAGVVGPDLTAKWFAQRAAELGHEFLDPVPQEIQVLSAKPQFPNAPGVARAVSAEDGELFADWLIQFMREAVPHDPLPSHAAAAKAAAAGRHMFWVVDGKPVSMAGIVRRSRTCAAISGVFTPPSQRGRGYAGSVTAAVVERIFAEGRKSACLYTDLRNPYSNRCYAKIGFKPLCESWHIARKLAGTGQAPQ